MTGLRSLLARGQDISTAAKLPLPVKRKTLSSVAALMALCIGTTPVPGAHAAVSTAFGQGSAYARATLADEMTLPGAQPVTSFDAIWPSLRDVNGAFAQSFALTADATSFAMTMPPAEQASATVCSRLASLCLPLVEEQMANGHQWFGHVIPLVTADASEQSLLDDTSGFGPPASVVQAAAGSIDTTLRESLARDGLPASVAAQIEKIFVNRIDIDAQAQAGDTYRVMLDLADGPNGPVAPHIVSIALRLEGETYDALWFTALAPPMVRTTRSTARCLPTSPSRCR